MFTSHIKCCFSIAYEALRPHGGRVLLALTFALAMAMEKSILPYAIKFVVDALTEAEHTKDMSTVYKYILITIGTLGLSEAAYRVGSMMMAFIYPQFQRNIRRFAYSRTMFHDMQFFLNNPVGGVSSQIYNLPIYCQRALQILVEVFIPLSVCLIVSTVLVFFVSKLLGAAFLLWVILHMSVSICMNRRCMVRAVDHTDSLNRLQSAIVDSISNILHVKIFDNYSVELGHFDKLQKIELKKKLSALLSLEYVKLSLFAITTIEFIIITIISVQQWQIGSITTGDVVFIMQTTISSMLTMWWFSLEISTAVQVLGICVQSAMVLDAPNTSNLVGNEIIHDDYRISFSNVYFSYNKGRPLFKNLNLEIAGGEKVAIIGFVGSGKTTLTNLLLKNYVPDSGSINIGGYDISDISLQSIHRITTVVPQSVTLFNRSLLENIAYGRPEAAFSEIVEASKKACCHDFIECMPNGYSTIIGEQSSLSTGQRQQILIARAILRNAQIVILDEPTSALDNITELKVMQAIKNLMLNKTALIIAHRLSTLTLVDKVILMSEGEIVDYGTHYELSKRSELYRTLLHGYIL